MNRSPLVLLLLAGCVVRPAGEQPERDKAQLAGAAYQQVFAERELPQLWPDAPLDLWLLHAERANGSLEAAFHRWIAALEKVPQASTQPTTAMLGLEHTLDGGAALERTALLLMTDSMANLLLPGRLEARGEAALGEARVAGAAFTDARLRLQTEVSTAYYGLALRDRELAILGRLQAVLAVQVPSVSARVRAGAAMQMELLQAQVALDRVNAEVARMQGERPGLVAALRAVVGAGPEVTEARAALPELAALRPTETEVVEAALRGNAELEMQRHEVQAKLARVAMAEWERAPEFSLRGVLMGSTSQTLGAAMTLPWLRGTAIEGAVHEAEANVRAAEALRRQTASNAVAMVLGEVAMLHAVEQEHAVLSGAVLPRLQQMATLARTTWSAGGGRFADWAGSLAMSLEVELAVARLRREHAVSRARLQAAVGGFMDT